VLSEDLSWRPHLHRPAATTADGAQH